MKMTKKEAIEYLIDKGQIKGKKVIEPQRTREEEQKIRQVMKEGKIYGDPLADIQW